MMTQIASALNLSNSSASTPGSCRRQMIPLIPAAPITRLKARQEEGTSQSREQLVINMLPLVKTVALKIRKRLPTHVEVDDLISDGVLGLIDAVARFNPQKRAKFESYAKHRIRGSILDGLRGADPVPRDIRRKQKNLEKHYQAMEAKLGRPAMDEEMSTGLGLKLAEWHGELNAIRRAGIECGARALSAVPASVPRSADPMLLAGGGPNPFDLCYGREQRKILSQALSELGERERQILTLYYKRGLTMQVIAIRMNVDASRVSQLHAAALVQLKAEVDSLLHSPRACPAVSGPNSMAAASGG